MKAIYIALKDTLQSFRSLFALAFMFGVPILVTVIFSFMFGSGGEEEESFTLPATQVVIVDLDETGEMGENLVELLSMENLNEIMVISKVSSAEIARQTVDNQEAGVAIIIPPKFSAAVSETGTTAEVELYQDPTLTIGPQIVRMIVNQFIEGFSGGKIVVDTAINQWIVNGQAFGPEDINSLIQDYIQASSEIGQGEPLVITEAPVEEAASQPNMVASILSMIMSGMMLFFAFFTAASTTMSILREDQHGTLARLFTTPTPTAAILNGKFLASVFVVLVQIAVLLVFGNLVFDINWGSTAMLFIIVPAATLNAAGLGIFLNSLMKDEKQAGMIFGGLMTVTGMLGMIEAFIPGATVSLSNLSYLVPQGWAFKALTSNMAGTNDLHFWLLILGNIVWALVLFAIGNMRFRKRFA